MIPPAPSDDTFSSICAVCELPIPDTRQALKEERRSRPYFFCSPRCAKEFFADPEKYLLGEEDEEEVE